VRSNTVFVGIGGGAIGAINAGPVWRRQTPIGQCSRAQMQAVPARLPNCQLARVSLAAVMPGLVPGIHVFPILKQNVDGRDKPGHDDV